MSSSKKLNEALPDGWVLCESKSVPGRRYYFNKKNGKSSWTQPKDEDSTVISKKSKKVGTPKEVPDKNNLKRKINNDQDDTTPKKKIVRVTEVSTPANKKVTSPEVSTKNSANKRLQQLRSRLSEDAQREQTEKQGSPMKQKPKASPTTSTETYKKNTPSGDTCRKTTPDLKSPQSEMKCSTTIQSPCSDGPSRPSSPSQFLTANKILCSMKAHLPNEYNSRHKAKDSFADIDEAICNQTAEYSIKHPSTPPQFSEASKIVSAIKSKLAYKSLVTPEIRDVKVFMSAQERLESLRKSLSDEVKEELNESIASLSQSVTGEVLNTSVVEKTPETQPVTEAMDVEDDKQRSPPPPAADAGDVVLVVDTNIFIHQLDIIKNVLNSRIKGYAQQPTLLVPWRVINELDRLKDNNNGAGSLCKRAKAAMDYLYQSLPENDRIKGQSLRDANSHIYPCEIPDDEILNCCLQQAERGKSVILLSNDKNLCNKALINGIKRIGLSELRRQLESSLSCGDPALQDDLKQYETSIYQLLSNILENEMRAKYNTLWQHVLFKVPPWSLMDVLQSLLKHWRAVFNEVFPRIEHLITELKNTLGAIESRGPEHLSQSQVTTFKDLSLDIARKCQIIPEYMDLAKRTVERIARKTEQCDVVNSTEGDEMTVIQAFEKIWTVFSSYCAKLCTYLRVEHSLEDRIASKETLAMLTSKWTEFSSQIYRFTGTIRGVLTTTSDSDSTMFEQLVRFEVMFKECLKLIAVDPNVINRDNLQLFCCKCGNMLQEAHTKFAQLTDLLDLCSVELNK